MKIVLLLFLGFFTSVISFDFADPQEDGVFFISSSQNIQAINVNENNDPQRFKFVLITGVIGTIDVNVNVGKEVLVVQIVDGDDSTEKYLTALRLDFDSLTDENTQPRFAIDVYENGDVQNRKTISLTILNLDDESPTLVANNCAMKENTSITIENSDCIFEISDRDGFLSTMDFKDIVGTRGESDIFEFQYKVKPADDVRKSDVYLVLKDGVLLDYEKITLYTFSVEAKDGAGHPTYPSSISIIVQVEDVSDEPPKWNSFESAFTVPEESEFRINVSATDGDYGINNPIVYAVTDNSGFVTINSETGEITVAPIDRDVDNNIKITFTVTAIEKPEPDSTVSGDIVLIIEDIDDNVAVLSIDGTDEKKIDTEVDEGETDLRINVQASDIDLGENALYDVILESDGGTEFTSAINVIPNRGYENMPLSLAVSKPAALDYEDPLWRTITMTLITVGSNNKSMTDSLPITIRLRDINDEFPIFASDEYTAQVREDVTQGYLIQIIKATDRDAEDANLKHVVLGTLANGIMEIEEFGGNITTRKDDAFDYEKQSEVIVQIQATDAVGHVQTAQLSITVLDVNDENPRLAVASTISVEENQPNGFVLDTKISASDEDTDADLQFSIDWTSSRATKNSRNLDQEIFDTIHCILVETIPGDTVNSASAKLSIIETQEGNTPDYEVFDTLYIQLVVTDKNTTKNEGTDSGLIAISIKDLNDNPPIFLTSEAKRQVTENTGTGTLVTTVTAIDKDIGDNIIYSIESADGSPMWFDINVSTGDILVNLADGESIDCDDPERYYLNYTVTANDSVHAIPTTISIYINDQNENSPQMEDQTKTIKEQAEGEDRDGEVVIPLNTYITDKDRDEPFHTVFCSFAATTDPDVTKRFQIDEHNQIIVALTLGLTLDREVNPNGFIFTLNCIDDPTRQSPNSNPINPAPQITIILEDINDNKPTIKNTDIRGVIDENSPIGPISAVYLDGDDADDGDNGLVLFNEITKIQRFIDDNLQEDPPQDLFSVSNDNKVANHGILTINKVLRNYYGDLVLTISLSDKGLPSLSQPIDVTLQVAKYNFEEPKYIFPADGETVFLRYVQDPNAGLVLYNDIPLDNIKATDQQNGKFGITFKVVEDSSGVNLFRVYNLADSQGQLQLTTTDFDKQRFTVTVTASIIADADVHGASFNKNITFSIDFFDIGSTDPVFGTNQDSVVFDENQVEQTFQLPLAAYSIANLPDEIKSKVFYITRDDQDIFSVDPKTGTVTILQELDYEETKSYTLVIYSSNSENLKQNPVDASKFTLTINVKDVNDNPPVFDSKSPYVTTLTVETDTRATILQVTATDVDTTSQNKLRFSIASTDASTDILKQIPDPFKIDNNGNIQPNFTPKNSYKGFFTLQLLVQDEDDGDDHSDKAEVKIYLVTKDNIVTFTFENDQDAVLNSTDEIRTILDTNFASDHYLTHVENANQAPGDNQNPRTTCDVYFLSTDSNLPIEAAEIKKKVTDLNFFSQLKQAFIGVGLLLLSFVSESPTTENLEATLKAWLIGVSVVLGSLCLILLIAFILKTRALNQRINKLSNTKFGSQESGLNRTGVNAPTTNKHALEGSNPVYNNDAATKDIDRRISVTSGDSDLIGVEEDEKFDYNYYNKNEINGVE